MARVSTRGVVAGILAIAVAAVCVRLGFWQLDRLEQRRARNAALQQALAQPALRLVGDSLAAVLRFPERHVYRRVTVAGAYDGAGEVVLRGRTHQGRPGVHIVTPLRIGGGDTAVLVNRGWVPAPDAATLDPRPFAEPGPRVVEGILQPAPDPGNGGVPRRLEVPGGAVQTYRSLDVRALREKADYVLAPLYVQQSADSEGASSPPIRVPPPVIDEGPHLGYAVQWFSFAAIALFGFLGVVLWGRRRR